MRFRSFLRKLAEGGTHHRYRHAAILAKGKVILGIGLNNSHLHAEVAAIEHALRADRIIGGATLYTLMLRRDGTIGEGCPCPFCMEALAREGVRKVVVYL